MQLFRKAVIRAPPPGKNISSKKLLSHKQCISVHYPRTVTSQAFDEIKSWNPTVDISQATTPPSSWYIENSIFALEAKTVFFKNWLQVGRVSQLSQQGSYLTGKIIDEPYLVVRNQNGELNAFYNVCRHHASILADGEGKSEEFVCPYHGWTYTLDGKLKRTTKIAGIKDFKISEWGLKPLQVTTWKDLIFIKFDNSPGPDLHKILEPIKETLDYQDLKWYTRQSYTMNCNWKVYCDNYLDGLYFIFLIMCRFL